MDEISTRRIAIALTFVAVPLLLRAIMGRAGAGGAARLRYSTSARAFSTLALAALLAAMVAAGLQPGTLAGIGYPAALSMFVFVALVMAMSVEFFRVSHDFGAAGVNYRTPWSRGRYLEWRNVASIEWRPTLKWLDIVPKDGGPTLHISPLLGGLAPFAQTALQSLHREVLDEDGEGRAALNVMAAGRGTALALSSRRPSELVTDLRLASGSTPPCIRG
jgi:hypothetical protein